VVSSRRGLAVWVWTRHTLGTWTKYPRWFGPQTRRHQLLDQGVQVLRLELVVAPLLGPQMARAHREIVNEYHWVLDPAMLLETNYCGLQSLGRICGAPKALATRI